MSTPSNSLAFRGERATFAYIQHHKFNADAVFSLLCPLREKEWLDGWDCDIILSHSNGIEMGCVFSTPFSTDKNTVWFTTQYDKGDHVVEFIRHTPGEHIVKINLKVVDTPEEQGSQTFIVYEYTGLNEHQNAYITGKLAVDFEKSVKWWERAINHFLETGKMLKR